MKDMIIRIDFLILFILPFCFCEPIIPESSFYEVKSYIPFFFFLNDKNESYFKFKNNNDTTDLVFNLALGKGYSVNCLAYSSIEQIKKKDKNYTDFEFNFTLNNNNIYFSKKNNTNYYFVCVDNLGFYYDDYITIFNEYDNVLLEDNLPFSIQKFYSLNSYTLYFEGNHDEKINLFFNSKNQKFNQLISISIDEKEEEEIKEYKFNRTYNSDFKKGSKYKIIIKSLENKYSENQETIMIYKQKRDVLLIEENSNIVINYINGNIYNFYVNVDDYKNSEEGIITFKYNSYSAIHKMYSYMYGKIINLENDKDETLLKNMPSKIEDHEFINEQYEKLDTIYQMYFRKNKEKESGKKTYLLIQIKLNDHDLYFKNENFTISLSQRIRDVKIDDELLIFKQTLHLKDYVPQLYTIKIEKNNKFSYVFYVNNDVARIYNGTILLKDKQLEKSTKKQLYGISKGTNDIDLYTIQLFGFEQDIDIRIETIESEVYFIRDLYRPEKSFSRELMNCNIPFYYIGNYDIATFIKHLYFEEIFGKFNLYYKNIVLSDDESILTRSNEKYLQNISFPLLISHFDIIEVKCKYPGYFNIHLLSDSIPTSYNHNGRLINFLLKGSQSHFNMPNIDNMNLEISSPLGSEINVELYGKEIQLNKVNKNYHIKNIPKKEGEEMVFRTNVDTIFDIKIGQVNLFKKIKKDEKTINDPFVLFELEKNINYKTFELHLSNIKSKYSFYLMKGDSDFASDPKVSPSFELIKDDFFEIKLTNPYDKYPKSENNDIYYLAFVFENKNEININLKYLEKENYNNITEKENKILTPSNNKLNIDLNNDEKKDLNIFSKICNYDSIKKVSISYYDNEIALMDLKNKNIEYLSINNPMIPIQIETQYGENISNNSYIGAEVIYYYGNLNKSKINSLNELNLTINNSSKIIKWDEIKENNVSYEFYFIDKESNDSIYLENDCFLKTFNDHNKTNKTILKDENKKGYFELTKNEYNFEKKGKFKINVVAIINDEIPYRLIYKSIDYDSELENGSYLWFIITFPIILIIVIFLVLFLLRGKLKVNDIPNTQFHDNGTTGLIDNENNNNMETEV